MASANHATVLVYHKLGNRRYEFLLGEETIYYTDAAGVFMFPRAQGATDDDIRQHPIFVTHPKYTFVRRERTKPGQPTSYKFTVHMPHASPVWGFPKGGKEASDATTIDTARREFWEEVGYNLEASKFTARPIRISTSKVTSDLYLVEVNAVEKAHIEEAFHNKMCTHSGELHNVGFVDLATAEGKTKNKLSEDALKEFKNLYLPPLAPPVVNPPAASTKSTPGGGRRPRPRRRSTRRRRRSSRQRKLG